MYGVAFEVLGPKDIPEAQEQYFKILQESPHCHDVIMCHCYQ